ncbi:MAG: HD domain-containing protein [Chloroflexota bacterium]|nr:HD domain-containing protein [Chloroflexota bacterium]
MRGDAMILFISHDLYQKAIRQLSGQEGSEKPFRSRKLPGNLHLELLDGKTDEISWTDLQDDGSSNHTLITFLSDRYADLKTVSAYAIKTIWYNPSGKMAPEPMPVQDLDIRHFDKLLLASSSLHIPTLAQCLTWWDEWDVPENVRRHSLTVSQAAYKLAVMMRNKGIAINPVLTHRGGLLHDLDKIKTLHLVNAHGQKAAAFLEKEGFPEIAGIVREHIMSTILNPNADNRSWEVKLVYFCDKLAEGDQLVPFNQRLSALYDRYPDYKIIMQQAEGPVWRMSDQICSILSIPSHANLISMLKGLRNP